MKELLKHKEVIDIILFGSVAKGSCLGNDIDIAIISEEEIKTKNKIYHSTTIKPSEIFTKNFALINTLLREGHSLKKNKSFSEIYNFTSKTIFNYNLKKLPPSVKVKIVNSLRGLKTQQGLVKENNGEWLANQVFIVPSSNEKLFEKFFLNFHVDFNKRYALIH